MTRSGRADDDDLRATLLLPPRRADDDEPPKRRSLSYYLVKIWGPKKKETMKFLDVQPRQLKFTFELEKQSSCSVHLVNRTNVFVAFKVKTTAPKRYCVEPVRGVILPRSTKDFTVTMDAQKTAPPDMQLQDRFVIQGIVAPHGSRDEDIVPAWFSKTNGRYIEEKKLRVVLETPISKERGPLSGGENLHQAPLSVVENLPNLPQAPLSGVENLPPSFVKEVDDLKLKISNLKSRFNEVLKTVVTMKDEQTFAIREREKLQQELVLLRRMSDRQLASAGL